VCEDERTIDDAVFSSSPQNWNTGSVNAVASRHEMRVARSRGLTFKQQGTTEDARGNVVFCDGHGGFIGRKDAIRQVHSGNPVADPVGF
jgi:prepilin-type processing-associated H-X9-DG protein